MGEKGKSTREVELQRTRFTSPMSQTIAEVVEPFPPTKGTARYILTCPSTAAAARSLGFQGFAVDKVDREVTTGFVAPTSLLT